jgi:hypothetical protein
MHKTTKTVIVFLALVPNLAGCGGHLPTMPTAPTTATTSSMPSAAEPAAGTLAGPRWALARAFKSVTCQICSAGSPKAGSSFNLLMTIEHSGESVRLTLTVEPSEPWYYDGATAGDAFAATAPSYSVASMTGDPQFDFVSDDHVSGHFSEDGRTLTGEEAAAYRYTSGEVLTFYYEWRATRID